eukprot:scaffold7176_cov165-Alexandrium_tamarense.AAC.2
MSRLLADGGGLLSLKSFRRLFCRWPVVAVKKERAGKRMMDRPSSEGVVVTNVTFSTLFKPF